MYGLVYQGFFPTQAIELNPVNAVYYANRSIANLRMENFGYALSDASKAIEVDPKYLKAYYRRAAAYMALGKYKLALKDYERVHKARPNDADAKKKYTECKKIQQQAAFAKAISVEENKGSIFIYNIFNTSYTGSGCSQPC